MAYFLRADCDLRGKYGAGRGELLGFQGVTEADRGQFTPRHLLTVVYGYCAAVAWLHNQVKPSFALG